MAEAFAACTQPVCDIGKWLWARIATRINYARKLSKNREVLRKKAHDLSLKRKDIVAEIERSNPQKIATNECDDWIGKVQEMANKVDTIQPELNEEKRCVGGLCLDIFARIELGKRVVNMIDDIKELLDKSKFERVVDAPVATIENQPDPPSTLAKSANRTLDMIAFHTVWNLSKAVNLAYKAESQLFRAPAKTPSTSRSVSDSNQAATDCGKQFNPQVVQYQQASQRINQRDPIQTKQPAIPQPYHNNNPYQRPTIDKCYRCNQPGHRSNTCPNRRQANLVNTTEDDPADFGNEVMTTEVRMMMKRSKL
ncbi:hypothetical protein RHSIM_Rhsim13G0171100 [Rhododendron simsii]|uniref:CCHC-type domain-containing protein n=1 Tax=Rhododendron simsii TaxID=118357 RepID=A0A834FZM8_RHOSS|nr:hypothetical protein RHSIM_Rhsim13G0171100 [Rhododendron simsii]